MRMVFFVVVFIAMVFVGDSFYEGWFLLVVFDGMAYDGGSSGSY